MIDTHSHLYAEEFDNDRPEVVERAKQVGVEKIILPNIDSTSLDRMLALERAYPNMCHAAIGLHPTSVDENIDNELELVKAELDRRNYVAVGEIGIDLYWDKTFYKEQVRAFQQQVEWALERNLPIIIHVRNSHNETIEALRPYREKGLKGVFHCFTGGKVEAEDIFDLGNFLLGIGGVVTFKNSGLAESLIDIPLEKIVLETDAPYLAPAPHRGKRNEPSFLSLIADKLAEVYGVDKDTIIQTTTANAKQLFAL